MLVTPILAPPPRALEFWGKPPGEGAIDRSDLAFEPLKEGIEPHPSLEYRRGSFSGSGDMSV